MAYPYWIGPNPYVISKSAFPAFFRPDPLLSPRLTAVSLWHLNLSPLALFTMRTQGLHICTCVPCSVHISYPG